jgi:hypothetical protein
VTKKTLAEVSKLIIALSIILPPAIQSSILVIAAEESIGEESTPVIIDSISLLVHGVPMDQSGLVDKGNVSLSVVLRNNNWEDTKMISIVQIVDEQGYTRLISFDQASIDVSDEEHIDIELPIQNIAGRYKVQFFVLSDLEQPQILTYQWFKIFAIS